MSETTIRYPGVFVQLSDEDGNIFFIGGRVRRALKEAGVPHAEIDAWCDELHQTASYQEALQFVMSSVETA
jgi:hypothetical protein